MFEPDAIHSILWDIYPAVPNAIRLGEVEAADEREAIEKAAKEFQQNPAMLIVVTRARSHLRANSRAPPAWPLSLLSRGFRPRHGNRSRICVLTRVVMRVSSRGRKWLAL